MASAWNQAGILVTGGGGGGGAATSGLVAPNSADGWVLATATDDRYLVADSTIGKEFLILSKRFKTADPQAVDMADAALALVFGTAGAGEATITSNVLFVDPNSSGASEALTLPSAADGEGFVLWINNSGSEKIQLDDSDSILLESGDSVCLMSNGSMWKDYSNYELAKAGGPATSGVVADNSATGFQLLEGTNPYLTAVSTNDQEALLTNKLFRYAQPEMVASTAAAFALVLGTPGADEAKLTSNVVIFDGSGGTGCALSLPASATGCDGEVIYIVNRGNQTITLNDVNTTTMPVGFSVGYPNVAVCLGVAGLGWVVLNTYAVKIPLLISGVAMAAGVGSTIIVTVGSQFDGKPVVVTPQDADATFFPIVSAKVAGGDLTITGSAGPTGTPNVSWMIDGR